MDISDMVLAEIFISQYGKGTSIFSNKILVTK